MKAILDILVFIVNVCIYLAILTLSIGTAEFLAKDGIITLDTEFWKAFHIFSISIMSYAVGVKLFIKIPSKNEENATR